MYYSLSCYFGAQQTPHLSMAPTEAKHVRLNLSDVFSNPNVSYLDAHCFFTSSELFKKKYF